MPREQRRTSFFRADRIFLGVLACVYVVYLIGLGNFLHFSPFSSAASIVEHPLQTSSDLILQHWTVDDMRNAIDADQQNLVLSDLTDEKVDPNPGKAASQQGALPGDRSLTYPLSTVGKVFFTNYAGQNMVCSGTAVVSENHSVVDTAGHCLYWSGDWVQNVIFCPLYENGNTPYGCWAATDLEVPSDWINAKPNDYHHDMGIAIVAPNRSGLLTEVVGGAGWAYNQPVNQPFYAYGYPAGYPFDGQTRKSCESSSGRIWNHGDGTVVSIPCNMTGGSSGGPWFIKIGNNWYLNGHNDFISSLQPGHMFSPYYDDTWHALYDKAQHA